MINAVVLMGRLVREPEIRTTTSGKSVCSFSLAVERDFQREEKTADYFDCVAWGNTAEFVGKYFHKGRMIALQGRLQARTYKDKEGNNRKVVEVLADRVSFTGEKRQEHETGSEYEPEYASGSQNKNTGKSKKEESRTEENEQEEFEEVSSDDDLPF